MRRQIPVIGILIFSVVFGLITAKTVLGQAVTINETTTGDQLEAVLEKAPNGTFFVAWESNGHDEDGPDIFGRQLDAMGYPMGSELTLNENTAGNQRWPDAAVLTGGRTVVVWQGDPDAVFGGDVRARLINADGTLAGNELILSSIVGIAPPVVVANATGGFLVAWTEWNNLEDLDRIYIQAFDADGASVGDEILIDEAASIATSVRSMDLAFLDNGELLIAWGYSTESRALARRLAADGNPLANKFRLDNASYEQIRPTIFIEPGGVLFHWNDGSRAYNRRMANDGTFLGDPQQFDFFFEEEAAYQPTPSGFLMFYEDFTIDFDTVVLALPLDSTGAPDGTPYRVSDQLVSRDCLGRQDSVYRFGNDQFDVTDSGTMVLHWNACQEDGTWDVTVKRVSDFLLRWPESPRLCIQDQVVGDVDVESLGGTDPVTMDVTNMSGFSFAPNPVMPGQTSVVTGPSFAGSDLNRVNITIQGNDGSAGDQIVGRFSLYSYDPLIYRPAIDAEETLLAPELIWRFDRNLPGFTSWQLQLARDANFTDLLVDTVIDEIEDTTLWMSPYGYFRTSFLEPGTEYFWRVRVQDPCINPGDWVESSFTTAADTVIASGYVDDPAFGFRSSTIEGFPDIAPLVGSASSFVVVHPTFYTLSFSNTTESYIVNAEIVDSTGGQAQRIESMQIDNINESTAEAIVTSTVNDDFLVVWGGQLEVASQRVGSDQSLVGNQENLGVSPNRYTYPAAATNSDTGEQIVVWADRNGLTRIAGQRIGTDGAPIGNVFQINTGTLTTDRPAIAWNPIKQEYLVTWESFGSPGTDNEGWSVIGRRLAADGMPIANDFQINDFTTGDQRHPSVAPMAGGTDFFVIWQGTASPGDDNDGWSVQGRRVDVTGPVDTDIQINTITAGDQKDPALAILPNGGEAVVVWQSATSPGDDSSGLSIVGRRLDRNGTTFATDFQINQMTAGDQFAPRAAAHPVSNEFMVVWRDATRVLGQGLECVSCLFIDGFEYGDLTAWSEAIGN